MEQKTLIQSSSMQEPTKTTPSHCSPCAEWKEGRWMYDFSRCLLVLEQAGKEQWGESFRIFREDHRLIYSLLLYMIGDREGAGRQGLSLEKGLLLTGPVGCGKTSLMKLLRMFLPPSSRYVVKSCREISLEFMKAGHEVINHYTQRGNFTSSQLGKAYCFDDLGLESSLKYYGNECNVIAEILLSRYDQFRSTRLLTHATTNLNSTEIEQIYGNRVRSRMREMFNLVAFPRETRDKRG